MNTLPPSNWYTDLQDPTLLRYWDGERWTHHTAPNPNTPLSQESDSGNGENSSSLLLPPPPPPPVAPPPVAPPPVAPARQIELEPEVDPRLEPELSVEVDPAFSLDAPASRLGQEEVLAGGHVGTSIPVADTTKKKSLNPLTLRKVIESLERENEFLRQNYETVGLIPPSTLETMRREQDAFVEKAREVKLSISNHLVSLRERVVVVEEQEMLQQVGYYEYKHVLDDSLVYKNEIVKLKADYKALARQGRAVSGATAWTVNDSRAQGKKMVTEISKLMFMAYNSQVEILVKQMKPHKLSASIDRLCKVRENIQKLGKAMDIEISEYYHGLRVKELELTADFLAMKEEEKEEDRERKAQLREEAQVQKEIDRQRALLEKEENQKVYALEQLKKIEAPLEAIEQLEAEIEEIILAKTDVEKRAANIKAGYVYVISNVGAFGESIIKIGMTRRQVPEERVKELSSASVPFIFDTHLLHYSETARDIEHALHQYFSTKRVNKINKRKEFFYATPQEVKQALIDLNLAGSIISFSEETEALEYHQSVNVSAQEEKLDSASEDSVIWE